MYHILVIKSQWQLINADKKRSSFMHEKLSLGLLYVPTIATYSFQRAW